MEGDVDHRSHIFSDCFKFDFDTIAHSTEIDIPMLHIYKYKVW